MPGAVFSFGKVPGGPPVFRRERRGMPPVLCRRKNGFPPKKKKAEARIVEIG
ncbi:hypothetical protein B4135_3682 [Caldibacillus debilis]|uniref:Uncharacterized protein n=1 Tax=Caldibacillus debilis TaxID=301148 RepID=A0A150LAI7_9BACI|nr:hypothetical protein B4135_3682 [Caldibacillus debilis]